MHYLELMFAGASPRCFTQPHAIFAAHTQSEAWQVLREVERLRAQGFAVAGYLSYELGYACVDLDEPARNATTRRLPYLLLGAFAPDAKPLKSPANALPFRIADFNARTTREQYRDSLSRIASGLHAGDYYQINLSVPFDFRFSGDPLAGFLQLKKETQAPYAAYLQSDRFALLSLSPELFLRFDGNRLSTKPMKGTASLDAVHTLASAKNRAEHVMIVDLLRNDLSKVCNGVDVTALFATERYPTFATMTSTITGTLKHDTPFHEILRALFPCGSITGAPKRAAIAAIAEFETAARDAYCGTIGYLLPDGTGEWNVAIRTAQLDFASATGRLDLGGGIVADSEFDDEWREIEIKGRFFETAKSSPHDRV